MRTTSQKLQWVTIFAVSMLIPHFIFKVLSEILRPVVETVVEDVLQDRMEF